MHAGPAGAGHFVKMIHNGIEYGMMQAFAEGFDIMKQRRATDKLPADERLRPQPRRHRRGLAARQRRDLVAARPDGRARSPRTAARALLRPRRRIRGEGRWTIEAAIEEAVPADVLTASLFARFRSRQQHTFAEKVLSAMRHGFGGHVEATARNRRSAMEVGVFYFPTDYGINIAELAQGAGGSRLRLAVRARAHPYSAQPEDALPRRRRAAQALRPHARSVRGAGLRGGGDEEAEGRHRHLPGAAARADRHRQGDRQPRPALGRPLRVRHRRRLERRRDGESRRHATPIASS